MKLYLTKSQFEIIKKESSYIFEHYQYEYDDKQNILKVSIPLYDEIDYTKFMKELKTSDRIQFANDAFNFAV